MHVSNPETIYSAGSGDWTQARLITVSGSARTVPMSHREGDRERERHTCRHTHRQRHRQTERVRDIHASTHIDRRSPCIIISRSKQQFIQQSSLAGQELIYRADVKHITHHTASEHN